MLLVWGENSMNTRENCILSADLRVQAGVLLSTALYRENSGFQHSN